MSGVAALWDQPADAAALVDDAAWAAAREYAAAPHTAVEETPRRRWLITGTPYEGLNGIYWAGDLNVAQALLPFQQAEVSMLWHAGPTSPMALPDVLADAGLGHYGDEPGMLLDLDATDEWRSVQETQVPAPAEDLEIRRVGTEAQLRAWVRIWAGPASHIVVDRLVALRAPAAFGVAARTPHLLAVADGEPVGCAAVWVGRLASRPGRPVAWLEHVATGMSARRRGVGTALVRACLDVARRRGVSHVGLTASPFAERLYRRMGFRQVCTVSRFLWNPQDPRS